MKNEHESNEISESFAKMLLKSYNAGELHPYHVSETLFDRVTLHRWRVENVVNSASFLKLVISKDGEQKVAVFSKTNCDYSIE